MNDSWVDCDEVCPFCHSENVKRGSGYPGPDDDELWCVDCDEHWADGIAE